jgi:hypothetical protein
MDQWAANDPDFAAMIGWEDTPAPFGDRLHSVWSAAPCPWPPPRRYETGGILTSTDGGVTWVENTALAEFPDREAWSPGAAGLTLHTLVSDPDDARKFWLAISAAGVFATEDGGQTWDRRNRLSNAEACGHHDHPAAPQRRRNRALRAQHGPRAELPSGADTLYQQNHHGTWRSRDGGRTWDDIGQGLPSTFGFPIAVHPHDPDTIWVVPLNGDSAGRYPPGASAAVWVSNDGGETWSAQHSGLPRRTAISPSCGRRWRPIGSPGPGSISAPTPGRLRLHRRG